MYKITVSQLFKLNQLKVEGQIHIGWASQLVFLKRHLGLNFFFNDNYFSPSYIYVKNVNSDYTKVIFRDIVDVCTQVHYTACILMTIYYVRNKLGQYVLGIHGNAGGKLNTKFFSSMQRGRKNKLGNYILRGNLQP